MSQWRGINNYTGTKTVTFTINKKDIADLQMEGKEQGIPGQSD